MHFWNPFSSLTTAMYLVSSLHIGPYPSWASDEPWAAAMALRWRNTDKGIMHHATALALFRTHRPTENVFVSLFPGFQHAHEQSAIPRSSMSMHTACLNPF